MKVSEMSLRRIIEVAATLSICAPMLLACGTYVPQLHEAFEQADVSDPFLVERIKQSIYCELRTAVVTEMGQSALANPKGKAIPDDWGAEITLSLQVDETGALNPGATISTPIGRSDLFSVGLGATLSSQATRIDKYYSYFSAAQLKVPLGPPDTSCQQFDSNGRLVGLSHEGTSFLISGNLGIDAWLKSALIQQNAIPSSPELKGSFTKLDVISYDVKFIVITTGTVTPTWKFLTLTAGTGTPGASANRTRTHELILTLGPSDTTVVTKNGKKMVVSAPSGAASQLHFASEIGQAVSSAIRSSQSLPPTF
jgi:hypothetical protein